MLHKSTIMLETQRLNVVIHYRTLNKFIIIKGEKNMKARIKFLSIGNKRLKSEHVKNWNNLIERYAPDMYAIFNAVGEEEGIKQIVQLRPEIIMLSSKIKDVMGLLIKIKQIHPTAAVFIMLGVVDDEQEAIDELKAHGAYKCYTSPLSMDTLIHDMYVALNME